MRTRTDRRRRAPRSVWTGVAATSVAALAAALALGCVVHEGPPPGPSAPPAGAAGCSQQPNMTAALNELRDARTWLERAEHDKGGWRGRAIAATDAAIRDTERGCAFADAR